MRLSRQGNECENTWQGHTVVGVVLEINRRIDGELLAADGCRADRDRLSPCCLRNTCAIHLLDDHASGGASRDGRTEGDDDVRIHRHTRWAAELPVPTASSSA